MNSTWKFILAFLSAFIALAVVAASILFINVDGAEDRRKRDADAMVISGELFLYMNRNEGKLPNSLLDLELQGEDVDVSPFSLVPPGSYNGLRDEEVIAVAREGGRGKSHIVIYADEEVAWE